MIDGADGRTVGDLSAGRHAKPPRWSSGAVAVVFVLASTFMLVGRIWANHHVMFDHTRHADRIGTATFGVDGSSRGDRPDAGG
ncbi:hypothetical protein GCM10009610_28450 [Pseudonocardia xinjiangensis]